MVSNVIARIPGTSSSGAIAINAHYDGGPTGPAAGDNGAGVAATLEVVRAIQAGPPLANDLIIVFSDAEEHGDLGSAAFNQLHPWAKDVRIAINFEAQGTGGPAMLYATSDQDGWLTGEYISAAPDPSAYSLLPELVRALPGMRLACDLEDYLLNGAAGLGFVIANDTPSYHTVRDNVAAIDRGSVQQEGGNTLAAVRHFGQQDLTTVPSAANRVYFNILPGVVIHYGGGWVLPFAAIITALVLTVVVAGIRRRMLSAGGVAIGVAALLLGSMLTVALVDLVWFAIKQTNSDYQVLLVGSYQTTALVTALSLIGIALMATLYLLLQRRVRLHNLAAGALVAWALLMWAVSLTAPGASYYVMWPLLFAVTPLAWAIFGGSRREQPGWLLGVLTLAILPAALLLPGVAYQVVGLLSRVEFMMGIMGGIPLLGLWALFITPLVGLYLFHLNALAGGNAQPYRWIVPGATATIAILLLGWTTVTSGFDADHPRPDHIAYELNADTGEARFISLDPELDSFTKQFFPANPGRADYEVVPGTEASVFSTPVTAVVIDGPAVTVLTDETVDGARTVTFRIASPRLAPELQATITTGGEILAAAINERALDLTGYGPAREGELQFEYTGIAADGLQLSITTDSAEPLTIKITETTYGLPEIPGLTIQPRTPDQMQAPAFPPDATIVRKSFKI
jgi:hypothetical protein